MEQDNEHLTDPAPTTQEREWKTPDHVLQRLREAGQKGPGRKLGVDEFLSGYATARLSAWHVARAIAQKRIMEDLGISQADCKNLHTLEKVNKLAEALLARNADGSVTIHSNPSNARKAEKEATTPKRRRRTSTLKS